MIVEINDFRSHDNAVRRVDGVSLESIEFRDGPNVVRIDPEVIREWGFTGLCNRDFIRDYFFADGPRVMILSLIRESPDPDNPAATQEESR